MRLFLYWITLQIISSKGLPFEVGSDDLPVLGVGGSSTKSETVMSKILRTLLVIFQFFFSIIIDASQLPLQKTVMFKNNELHSFGELTANLDVFLVVTCFKISSQPTYHHSKIKYRFRFHSTAA